MSGLSTLLFRWSRTGRVRTLPRKRGSRSCGLCVQLGSGRQRAASGLAGPEFDPSTPAFYYVRVLENPTCRWSTWDSLRVGEAPRDDVPALVRERAWSSPIWIGAAPGA